MTPMANLKMTNRDDCAVSACRAPHPTHSVYESTHPLLVGSWGEGGEAVDFWTDVCHPPLHLPASYQHLK